MYERVFVLGFSHLAFNCSIEIRKYGKIPEVFDTNVEKSLLLEQICISNEILYKHLSKIDLMEYLFHVEENVLIISAFNMYLIPERILNKNNITAINCHHSILPRHAGPHGTTWAIYEQDNEAGITWHYITSRIDAGDIIITKKCELNETITAWQLSRKQYSMALEGFNDMLEALLNGSIHGVPQDLTKRGEYHHSKDIPNNGFLDPAWDFNKISAFLRSLDYGFLDRLNKPIFPKPKLLLDNDRVVSWEKYILEKDKAQEEIYFEGNDIVISKPTGKVRLINIFTV